MAKKTKAPEAEATLTKKERKALEQREAELMAELEKKAAKKTKKPKGPDLTALNAKALKRLIKDKSNGKELRKAARRELEERDDIRDIDVTPEADGPVKKAKKPVTPAPIPAAERDARSPKKKTLDAADKVLADKNAADGAKVAAKTAKAAATEAKDDESDEAIKARVKSKREAREALVATADSIDLDDHEAVKAYNAALAELGGGTFLTSTATKEAMHERMQEHDGKPRPGKTLGDEADRKAVERGEKSAKKPRAKKAKDPSDDTADDGEAADAATAAEQVVEPVETETGTIYAAGPADEDDERSAFAKPSEGLGPQLEEGRNGYKIIALNADGKPDFKRDGTPRTVRQYTRVTTFIDNLDDKTTLTDWKLRVALEGVTLHDTAPTERGEKVDPVLSTVADLLHRRDVKIAKAYKADRKGKLAVGERARIETAALKEYKDALNAIVKDMLDLGGAHEKAERGTNLHALAEVFDAKGIEPIDAMLEAGTITPTDHASIVAYGKAMADAGIKVVAMERVVVNDSVKYAGRFDRTVMAKRPGDQRARKVIADIKTGRVDYGVGKIAQQLAMYADADAYDLVTGERSPLGVDKTWGLLIHMPQGEGTCTIHVVDLVAGRKANAISAQVRAWRNEGKKAVDLTVDLATAKAVEA